MTALIPLSETVEGVVVHQFCHSHIYVGDQMYACLIDWSIKHDIHEESGTNHEGKPYSLQWQDEPTAPPMT